MDGKSEGQNVGVILNKLDLLDEERGRFHQLAFGAGERAGAGIDVDFALEQAGALLPRLDVENMHRPAAHLRRALVGEFVVRRGDGGKRRVVFLHVVHFLLQQAGDDVAFDESVAGKTQRLNTKVRGAE